MALNPFPDISIDTSAGQSGTPTPGSSPTSVPSPAPGATPERRWTSRKFLLSLAAQATAVAVLLWPEHESVIVETSRSVTALVVLLLTTLGYITAEASVDRRRPAATPGGVG